MSVHLHSDVYIKPNSQFTICMATYTDVVKGVRCWQK